MSLLSKELLKAIEAGRAAQKQVNEIVKQERLRIAEQLLEHPVYKALAVQQVLMFYESKAGTVDRFSLEPGYPKIETVDEALRELREAQKDLR